MSPVDKLANQILKTINTIEGYVVVALPEQLGSILDRKLYRVDPSYSKDQLKDVFEDLTEALADRGYKTVDIFVSYLAWMFMNQKDVNFRMVRAAVEEILDFDEDFIDSLQYVIKGIAYKDYHFFSKSRVLLTVVDDPRDIPHSELRRVVSSTFGAVINFGSAYLDSGDDQELEDYLGKHYIDKRTAMYRVPDDPDDMYRVPDDDDDYFSGPSSRYESYHPTYELRSYFSRYNRC